jgi:prevent-host-death family protein
MAYVGIRQFKSELSRYLREVRRGRPIYVSDRGEVVAEVTVPRAAAKASATSRDAATARLRALVAKGVLRPPARINRAWTKGPLVRLKPGSVRRILDADRAE